MKLTWYGHSCFKLESSSGSLVFDPYAKGKVPGHDLPLLEADMVLSSHMHFDHFCPEAVKLSGQTPSFEIYRLPCAHDDVGGVKRGGNYISLVESEGIRIAHLGDLGHLLNEEQLKKLGRVDVLLVPVGGTYTVDAAQAAQITRAVGAAVSIPMHYRGDSFGFDNIGRVEDYLAHFEGYSLIEGAVFEISAVPEGNTVAVFSHAAC